MFGWGMYLKVTDLTSLGIDNWFPEIWKYTGISCNSKSVPKVHAHLVFRTWIILAKLVQYQSCYCIMIMYYDIQHENGLNKDIISVYYCIPH